MKVSVFGLGYVGSVSVAGLASLGHEVIGVDVNPMKVQAINAGQSPMVETGLDGCLAEGVRNSRISSVSQASEAIARSELSLICVGTPSQDNGSQDLSFIDRVCREIGQALADKGTYHTVVVRSTVLPGTTEQRVIPLLEEASGRRAGSDFGVAFNPEFLREGTAIEDFFHPPYTIVGQYDDRTLDLVRALYEGVEAPLLAVPLRVAEMIKFVSNSFHALKVTFANEVGNICKRDGIDSHQVMDIICMDRKLNLSSYYLKPGYAFGGSCLPKDVRALLYHAHHLDLRVPVLESILPSNELQVHQAWELIRQTGRKNIGMLGFAFKAGTDDLRNSPQVELIEALIGKGYRVRVYDESVSLQRLHGANRAFIEHEIPHIACLMSDSIDQVITQSEVVVIANKAAEYGSALKHIRNNQVVIDLARVANGSLPPQVHYEGICW